MQGSIKAEEILQAREKLNEQLQEFRAGMLSLAPRIRSAISANASISDVYEEARYLADTEVVPALQELKRRLRMERGRFWRSLLQKVTSRLPRIALNWTTKGAIAGAVEALETGGEIALGGVEREKLRDSVHSFGGLGFLLSVSQLPSVQASQDGRDV
jgi:hypothetical protein